MTDWISPDDRMPKDNQRVIATDGVSVLPVIYLGSRLRKYTWSFDRYVTDKPYTRLEGHAYFREGDVTGWKPIANEEV